jgi:RNA polymerase sigma factor (sigma-70 family)
MTKEQVEEYLTRLDSKLRQQHIVEPTDGDLYQRVCIILVRKADKLTVTCDKDFEGMFYTFMANMRKRAASDAARQAERGNMPESINDYLDDRGETRLKEWVSDPWTSPRAQAIEYIELLPHCYRQIFIPVFLEGMTEAEVARMLGWSSMRVSQMIRDGLNWIREEIGEPTK